MKKMLRNKFVLAILCLCFVSTVAVAANIILVQNQAGASDSVSGNSTGLKNNGVYDIPSNPTKYQKEVYLELSNALEGYVFDPENKINDQDAKVCESVIKNFVADFYTWTNKSSSYDVGGLEFVFSDLFLSFQHQARNEYYADLDGYIEQYGRENLPEVVGMETNIAYADSYEFNFEKYRCYYGEAFWQYDENSVLDTSNWPNGAGFHVIYHEATGCWEIAQIWNVE